MITKISKEHIEELNELEREFTPLTRGELKAQKIRDLIVKAEEQENLGVKMRELKEDKLPIISKEQRVRAIRKMYNQIEKLFLESKNTDLSSKELSRLIAIQYSLDFYLGFFGNKYERKTRQKLLRKFFDISLANEKFVRILTKETKIKRNIKLLRQQFKKEREIYLKIREKRTTK